MDFELGGVAIQAGFPLDVTVLCIGLVAGYVGLVRRHGQLMAPQPGEKAVTTRQAVSFTAGVMLFWVVDGRHSASTCSASTWSSTCCRRS